MPHSSYLSKSFKIKPAVYSNTHNLCNGILQTQVQAMAGHVDFGLDLQAAIDMPRARLWDGTQVYIERRVPHPVCVELSSRGHKVALLPDFSWRTGGMQAVGRDPESGALVGAADSRRDGAAIPA